MRFRTLRYNLGESFRVSRWVVAVMVIAFCSVVSIYRFIELSGITNITFSSLEITYLVLNDTVNKVYVYLPLYTFIICGIVFDDNFGAIEILKSGSRKRWMTSKIVTLFIFTIIFFLLLFILNLSICNRVFPYSQYWSADFVKYMILQGDHVTNYMRTPGFTIGTYFVFYFFLYFLIGMVSIFISLYTDREEMALFLSLGLGIGINLLIQNRVVYQDVKQTLLFLSFTAVLLLVLFVVNYRIARKKNFLLKKRLS